MTTRKLLKPLAVASCLLGVILALELLIPPINHLLKPKKLKESPPSTAPIEAPNRPGDHFFVSLGSPATPPPDAVKDTK